MKILCNLHPLGKASHGTVTRTGVFRVVEHLIRGLAASQEELSFHAVDHLWQSWLYYEEHLQGPRTKFLLAPKRLALARHVSPLERFVSTTLQNRALYMRALRYASVLYGVAANRVLVERLDDRVLAETDIYHSPFLPIAPQIKRHRRLRRFTTVYDLIAISNPELFGGPTVDLIRSMVDGFDGDDYAMCISEATRVALLTHTPQLDSARVFVAPLAAGAHFYPEKDAERVATVCERIGLARGVPYLLSLCTLEPRKNLEAVIRAFARLHREGQVDRELRLVLVGNIGWKTERVFAALEEAQDCREAILLTGFVPDSDLAALYTGARAFVYMARIEGFGLPPLEAMQCGTPVVTSNTSSLPEVVGDAGVQVAPDDLDGLCTALLRLSKDDAYREDLASRSVQRAALFSWERFIDQNLAAYRTALAA